MKTHRPALRLLATALAAAGSINLHAAPISWDGETNSTWGTAANWSGNVVPTGEDDVIFDVTTGLASNLQVNGVTGRSAKSITADLARFRLNADSASGTFTFGTATAAGSFILTDKFTTETSVFDANSNRELGVSFHHELNLINRGTGLATVGQVGIARVQTLNGSSGAGTITFGGSGSWSFLSKGYLGKRASGSTQTLAVVLSGSGPDTFTGVLQYGGSTAANLDTLAINSGTYRLNNATTIASSGVTVGTAGTLDGIGKITGNVSVSGHLAAGLADTIGQLEITGHLALSESAQTTLRIANGNTNDSLLGAAASSFTQDGLFIIADAGAITAEGQWTLFSGFGTVTGQFDGVVLSSLGALTFDSGNNTWSQANLGGFDWNFDAASGLLTATTAIPEPAAAPLLLGAGVLISLSLRRRSRRA